MLVLTRKLGEAITIGDDVKIVVVDIDGNQVKVGIEAPRHIDVYREELYEKIRGRPFCVLPHKKDVNVLENND